MAARVTNYEISLLDTKTKSFVVDVAGPNGVPSGAQVLVPSYDRFRIRLDLEVHGLCFTPSEVAQAVYDFMLYQGMTRGSDPAEGRPSV